MFFVYHVYLPFTIREEKMHISQTKLHILFLVSFFVHTYVLPGANDYLPFHSMIKPLQHRKTPVSRTVVLKTSAK